MATNVHLTPDLEQFARHCVETGRYNNVSEVVRSALRMLKDSEARRDQFMAMLKEAETESERDGFVTMEELTGEIEDVIARAESRRG